MYPARQRGPCAADHHCERSGKDRPGAGRSGNDTGPAQLHQSLLLNVIAHSRLALLGQAGADDEDRDETHNAPWNPS
jgi:hypothetical protein